ncbi:MAG: UbiD family decarboxylase [Chloroflexi bacterium]|nr:UbiD family decarboxylase [Chloroflexota bacterium]
MKDLQSFAAQLARELPEEIVRVSRGPLSPAEGECVAILHHLFGQGRRPLAVFEHVTTLAGDRWPGSVAFQVDGTWSKFGAGYGLPRERLTPLHVEVETAKRAGRPFAPVVVNPGEAPVKQRVLRAPEISFFDLPGYRGNEKDARPGWLTGVIVGKDPDDGRYNTSWHRAMIVSPSRASCKMEPRDMWRIVMKYRERGEDRVPFAQVFGHHPQFGLAAALRPGQDMDEYAFAGGLLGEPLRITPSETWGEDLMIPADAEVVMEGYISTRERELCGPWVDMQRYYAPQTLEPAITLTAVNMRESPMFQAIWVGQGIYTEVATGSYLRHLLASRFPTVGAINFAAPGVIVVQFHPTRKGDVGRLVGLAHSYADLVKHVIVVDDDVDPFDLSSVMWAMGTRVDANRQTYVVPNLSPLGRQDPSASGAAGTASGVDAAVGGLVIDSTRAVGEAYDEIGHPAPDVLDRVRLEEYLP